MNSLRCGSSQPWCLFWLYLDLDPRPAASSEYMETSLMEIRTMRRDNLVWRWISGSAFLLFFRAAHVMEGGELAETF